MATMLRSDRLRDLMETRGLSQSELARRVGVTQATIYKLTSGTSYGSKHLHVIARELQTTPAYLTGEIDDPDAGAPPPRLEPRVQFVTMQVALPPEEALAEMFEGQLLAFGRLQGAELARALAKRLPRALARLQAQDLYYVSAPDEPDAEGAADPAIGHRARRQAQRT